MAQLNTSNQSSGKRRLRRSLVVDMTAMVDVAFLLLTFFILTSSLTQTRVMEMVVPAKDPNCIDCGTDVKCSNYMSIYLGEEDKVYYYTGCEGENLEVTHFKENGIRKEITKQVAANPDLVIAIKPTEHSRYQNVVDIFDEMEITGARRYALADVNDIDKTFLAEKGLK